MFGYFVSFGCSESNWSMWTVSAPRLEWNLNCLWTKREGIFDMVEVEVEVEVAAAGAVARCWFELASFQRPFVWPGHCS